MIPVQDFIICGLEPRRVKSPEKRDSLGIDKPKSAETSHARKFVEKLADDKKRDGSSKLTDYWFLIFADDRKRYGLPT